MLPIYKEFDEILTENKIHQYKAKPVSRKYCFDDLEPELLNPHYLLEVRYPVSLQYLFRHQSAKNTFKNQVF